MAITRWIGTDVGNEGDVTVAANWDNGVPGAGDSVYFDSGSENADTNMRAGAVLFAELVITEGFTGDILETASGLGWLVNATLLYERGGGGEHYYDGTYPTTIIDNTSTDDDAVHIDDSAAAGGITSLLAFRGNITLETGLTATTIEVGYTVNQSADVDMTIQTGVTNTTIWQNGGTITDSSTWTNLYLVSGTFNHEDVDATNVIMWDGTYNFNAEGHVLTDVMMRGGLFDASGEPRAKTITDMTMWPGSVVNLKNQSNTIVVTNGVLKHGGRLVVDQNTNLT